MDNFLVKKWIKFRAEFQAQFFVEFLWFPTASRIQNPLLYLGCSGGCPLGERHSREKMASVEEMSQREMAGKKEYSEHKSTQFHFFLLLRASQSRSYNVVSTVSEINPQEVSPWGWFKFRGWVLSTSNKDRAHYMFPPNRWPGHTLGQVMSLHATRLGCLVWLHGRGKYCNCI